MSTSVIPNPKKEIRISFAIDKIKVSLKKIPESVPAVKLIIDDDTMNFYQFEVKSAKLFSLGTFLEISLHEISEKQTLIQFECRRRVGWIDSGTEYSETIKVITDCIGLIGKGLA